MKTSTWLSSAAFVALLASSGIAEAGQLYVAAMNAAGVVPTTTSTFTGTGYLVLNTGNTSGTYYVIHNVGSTLSGIQTWSGTVGQPGTTLIHNFVNKTSLVIEPVVGLNPAVVIPELLNSLEYITILTTTNPAGDIRGQFAPRNFGGSGTSTQQKSIANLLDLIPGNGATADQILVSFAENSRSDRDLDQFSGRTLYAQNEEILDGLLDVETAAFAHTAESEAPVGLFSSYIKGGYASGRRNGSTDQPGSKITRPYFLAGIDYGLSDTTVVGITGGFIDGVNKFKDDLSQNDIGTVTGAGYFATAIHGLQFDLVGEYGSSKIKTKRNFSFATGTATSQHNAESYAMAVKVAYPLHFKANWTVGPYALVDIQHVNIKGYTEGDVGNLGLVVPAVKSTNTGGELGAVLQAPLGTLMQARIEGGYRLYLNKGNNAAIPVAFNGTAGSFNANMLERDSGAGRFGFSLWGTDGGYLHGEVGYHGHYSKRTLEHVLDVRFGLRI